MSIFYDLGCHLSPAGIFLPGGYFRYNKFYFRKKKKKFMGGGEKKLLLFPLSASLFPLISLSLVNYIFALSSFFLLFSPLRSFAVPLSWRSFTRLFNLIFSFLEE